MQLHAVINTPGERYRHARCYRARLDRRTYAAHKVFACAYIERRFVAINQPQRQQRLRCDAIVVVVHIGSVNRADPGVSHTEQARALQLERFWQAPLRGRADRKRSARYAKELRRDIVIAAA